MADVIEEHHHDTPSGNNHGVLIAVIVILVIIVALFVFTKGFGNRNSDTGNNTNTPSVQGNASGGLNVPVPTTPSY
jgi:hypothetical protein